MGAALTAGLRVGRPEEPTPERVVRLVQEVMAEGAALGWPGVPSDAEAVRWWDELLTEVAAGTAAVSAAYDGADLVGLGEWRRYALAPQAQNADLEKVFVARRCRGSGAGRLLVEHLIAQARAAGIEVLTLQCRGNNHGAIRLYERLGFHEYGRVSDFVGSGRHRWDKVVMALDLRTGAEDLDRHGSDPVGEGASP